MPSIYFYLLLLTDAAYHSIRSKKQQVAVPVFNNYHRHRHTSVVPSYNQPSTKMSAFFAFLAFALFSLVRSSLALLVVALFVLLLLNIVGLLREAVALAALRYAPAAVRLPQTPPATPPRSPQRRNAVAHFFGLPLSRFGIVLLAYPPPSQSEMEILVGVHDRFLSELDDRYVRITPRRALSVIERSELANVSLVQDLTLTPRLRVPRLSISGDRLGRLAHGVVEPTKWATRLKR